MDCLKIKKVMCKVADEDRSCDYCNSEMVHVGWKFVREEIEIVPAEVYRVQYYQETVACPNCKEFAPYFKQAPIPSPLIRGSYASHSAVAYIMYQKYYLYIPLYRQEKDWAEHGVILGRTTMANWIIRLAFELLKPIFDLMHQRMIERDILYADETPCQVLKEDGRTPQQKSYMWVYIAMEDDLPTIILYDYEPGRSGDYPGEFLKGFDGYCHCDGYSGYNKIAVDVK